MELPVGYRLELDMLEQQARDNIDSGILNNPLERTRRFDLLTQGLEARSSSFGSSKWDSIPYDENYMVTSTPLDTEGISHGEIIGLEFKDFDFKRILPLKTSSFAHGDLVIDMFYTFFCGDVEIDSEVVAYARKLRQAVELVPGILFLSQNYGMLQTEIAV